MDADLLRVVVEEVEEEEEGYVEAAVGERKEKR